MLNVLVIWQEVPEACKAYALGVGLQDVPKVRLCHGNLLNAMVSPEVHTALDWLNEELSGLTPEEGPIDAQRFDLIIITGFIL